MQCQLGIMYEWSYHFHLTHHYNKIKMHNLPTFSTYDFTLLMITKFRDLSNNLLNQMKILAMDFPPSPQPTSPKLIRTQHIKMKLLFQINTTINHSNNAVILMTIHIYLFKTFNHGSWYPHKISHIASNPILKISSYVSNLGLALSPVEPKPHPRGF